MGHLHHALERSSRVCVAVILAWIGIAASAAGQQLLHTFTHDTPRKAVAFSSDDSRIALLDSDIVATDGIGRQQELSVWDLKTGKELRRLPINGEFPDSSITFLAENKAVAMYDCGRGGLVVWDFETGARRDVVNAESAGGSRNTSVAFSRDRNLMASSEVRGPRNVIFAQRTEDAASIAEFRTSGVASQLLFSSDGSTLLAVDRKYDKRQNQFTLYVHEWDLQRNQKPRRWGPFPMTGSQDRDNRQGPGHYCLSPDSRTLATTLPGNGLLLIDISTGQQSRTGAHLTTESLEQVAARRSITFVGWPSTVLSSIAFTPDGYQLVTAAYGSREIRFWPVRANVEAGHIAQPDVQDIVGFQISDSGCLLSVTGRRDRQYAVMVWRLPSR